MPEPIGVMALVCPEEFPLLGFVSLVAPAIAMGNTVVVVPSERNPFSATDFDQVLETSDVPAGVVNIVTGPKETLAKVLAEHDDVDLSLVLRHSRGEQDSRTHLCRQYKAHLGRLRTASEIGATGSSGEGQEFLREATHVKNIWTPYGE